MTRYRHFADGINFRLGHRRHVPFDRPRASSETLVERMPHRSGLAQDKLRPKHRENGVGFS